MKPLKFSHKQCDKSDVTTCSYCDVTVVVTLNLNSVKKKIIFKNLV